MTVLIIDQAARERIKEAMAKARAKPLSLQEVVKTGSAIDQSTDDLPLAKRPEGSIKPRSEPVIFPGGLMAAISYEHQPAGFCAHLSVSSPTPGKLPTPEAVIMIAAEFGLNHFAAGRYGHCRVWKEEFDPGHEAINVVELITEGQSGHA